MGNIPASVLAASARADALIKQQSEARTSTTGDSPETTPTTNTNAVVDPAKAVGEDKSATPTQAQSGSFEAKYRVLQGKYNAEVPRLNTTVRTLQEQVASLTDKNTRLVEQSANIEIKSDDPTRIDPDTLGEYGAEFADVAKKLNLLTDENTKLRNELARVTESQGKMQDTQGKTQYEGYIGTVSSSLKAQGQDFKKLNADPDFLTWLQESHPFTGQPRHAGLQSAERAMDVTRTMLIFDEYLNAPPSQKENPKPKVVPKPPFPNLQPGNTGTGSDVTPPMTAAQSTSWTRDDISRFYQDKADGVFKGREAEFKAFEADLFLAQKEGRVR